MRSMSTASRWIEAIISTSIAIITVRNDYFTFVRRRIAFIRSAAGALANNWFVYTSSGRIAVCCGASWSWRANFRSRNNSFNCIACVNLTLIS